MIQISNQVFLGKAQPSGAGSVNVVEDKTSTSITLAEAKANTIYDYGTLTSLTVTAVEI